MRLLIVDDSQSVQKFLYRVLAKYGECDQAFNGLEAVKFFEKSLADQEGYDVVFMDIMMPEMDGLAAVERMRAMESEQGTPEEERVKIIMLSCLSDTGHMMQAQYESGADAYITKPFDQDILAEAMSNLGLTANPLDNED